MKSRVIAAERDPEDRLHLTDQAKRLTSLEEAVPRSAGQTDAGESQH
ncbi:MAG: hypothetical protein OXG35_13495 [Acidobacteria bacterium]|nr:hypothetical protein [Acidobacteriota bacterium]